MPSHHLLRTLLKAHHTVAPKAMQIGPISHHWTGTQVDLVLVTILLLAAFFGIRALGRNSD